MVCFGLGENTWVSVDHTEELMGSNLLLTRLEDIAVLQEERLHLVNASRGNENEVENSEESQLQRESSISDLPERETTK